MMQHLGPLITSLDKSNDAVVRIGAVLVVKTNGSVSAVQLTAAQQLALDHSPHLALSPHAIIEAITAIETPRPPSELELSPVDDLNLITIDQAETRYHEVANSTEASSIQFDELDAARSSLDTSDQTSLPPIPLTSSATTELDEPTSITDYGEDERPHFPSVDSRLRRDEPRAIPPTGGLDPEVW
jgi:hypothetical protein